MTLLKFIQRLTANYVVVGERDCRYAYTRSGVLKQMSACRDPHVEAYEMISGIPAIVPVAARALV